MSLIIDWLFPRNCFGCNRGNKYLCSLCESKLISGVLTQNGSLEGLISIYKYDGLIREIIEKIKYEYVSDAVEELAQLMAKKLSLGYPNIVKYWRKENFVLIPIPLFWQRKNWRGFNQSELLAESLAKFLDLGYSKDVLIRSANTKTQAKIKNRQLRRGNIKDAFDVSPDKTIPKKVVLVDDVITSGATIAAASKTLKLFGSDQVWGLSLCGAQK